MRTTLAAPTFSRRRFLAVSTQNAAALVFGVGLESSVRAAAPPITVWDTNVISLQYCQ